MASDDNNKDINVEDEISVTKSESDQHKTLNLRDMKNIENFFLEWKK